MRKQISPKCEAIIVDDGSTDDGLKIVENRFKEEIAAGTFRVIRIKNSGPGEARNVGVRAAKGQYIGFLDSDDLLLKGYFDTVLDAIRNANPDIIQFHVTRFLTEKLLEGSVIRTHGFEDGVYLLSDVRIDIFGIGKWFPPARVFLKELLLKHPFPSEKVFYEDLTTISLMFLREGTIALLNKSLIGYRVNALGTTSNHTVAHAKTLEEFFWSLSAVPETPERDILRVHVGRAIAYFVAELSLSGISYPEIAKTINQIEGKSRLYSALKFPDLFFLYFPFLYVHGEKVRHALRNLRTKLRNSF